MNRTDRMARHGSERSLHSLAVQTTAAATTPVTPSGSEAANGGRPSSPRSAGVPTVVSPEDSRIPRPSSTLLRRSASMRLRGERISHIRPTAASSSPHQQTHRNHRTSFLQQHRQNGAAGHNNHSYQRQDNFPVITENGDESPRHRSLSLSLTPARPRHVSAADDSDGESVKSFGSVCSTASACDHAHFALNGTTWSGRSRKYVVHCSSHNEEGDQYLTPTQRAARQLRKFQALLKDARKEIEDKDREIFRLTKEVVELRLYKASLNSPDERTDSSDALTVREGNPLSPESPCCKDLPDEGSFEAGGATISDPTEKLASSADLPSSLADSGHFEDGSVHSKDSVGIPSSAGVAASTVESVVPAAANGGADVGNESLDEERRRIVDLYERRIEEMHRGHIDEIQELKQRHNDKVESLLSQLSEVNTRYCEVRPAMDNAETRTRELEHELEVVKAELAEQKTMLDDQEERNKKMYLKMYTKGQEAARLEHEDELPEQARGATSKTSTAELMRQLTLTQAELDNIKAMYRRIVESRNSQGALDPEITLQFLKSAVYYFLTDKENFHGHLNAIESILGFTDTEKLNIDKAFGSARK